MSGGADGKASVITLVENRWHWCCWFEGRLHKRSWQGSVVGREEETPVREQQDKRKIEERRP
jgi:hypothetical protein